MRDAKNLVRLAKLPHFKGDLCGYFSPDIGINLVKNKEGYPVLIGKGRLQGQHDPRYLPARGDGPEGSATEAAGRAFAAYGGVYIVASLMWMTLVEKASPDRWDLIGGAVCLAGAGLILFAPRG
jgi:hypothetical protein